MANLVSYRVLRWIKITGVEVRDSIDYDAARSILSGREEVFFRDQGFVDGSVGFEGFEPDRTGVSSDEAVEYLDHLESLEIEGRYDDCPDVLPGVPFEELSDIQAIFDYDQSSEKENILSYEVVIYGDRGDNREEPAIIEFTGEILGVSPSEAREEIEDYIEIPF